MSDTDKKPVSIFAMYATDRDAEENGKWFELAPGMKFKLRRFKSQHATKVREALEKPFDKLRKNGALDTTIMTDIIKETIARSIIVDWEGVIGTDDSEIPYSAARAQELIEALPELADEIAGLAGAMDNFRDEDDAETLGN